MSTSNSTPTSDRRVIYDLGSNNGDDIPYYLLKADKVVAVEAVPALAEHIRRRFAAEISDGRLVVENCVLTDDPAVGRVPFYVHKTEDLLSRLPRPAERELHEFHETVLPAATIAELVRRHGAPYYVKIDLEGYDNVLLKDLFAQRIFPPYISAEAHTIDVFCTLVACGGYGAFKIVSGAHVGRDYSAHAIETRNGLVTYRFPSPHSSGPFGNDVNGEWLDGALFLRYLAHVGPGWIDIHASRIERPSLRRVRKLAEITSHVLREAGMRLRLPALMRLSDRIWGVA